MSSIGLLIHPRGMPEVMSADQWDQDAILHVLGYHHAENYTLDRGLRLWQANRLDVDFPVNKAAEVLVGEGNYYHLRGTVLVTGDYIGASLCASLTQDDIARLTVALATARSGGT